MAAKARRELLELKDEELAEFIRETIVRLHIVADNLERYANQEIASPEVGFDTNLEFPGNNDDSAASS